MDESHHWLVSRDSSSLTDLFDKYKYDGHPMLWVLCLWLISKVTSNIIFVKIFQGLIAILIAIIILFKSPFRKRYNIFFIFSYYPLFEYGILSRNYAMTILFLLLFCIVYEKNRKLLLPFFLLGLVCNSHLFGLILSALLSLKILYDERQNLRNQLGSILLLIFMVIFALFTIKAPSDHYFYFDINNGLNLQALGKLVTIWWKAIVPFPDIWDSNLWNTNFFTSNYKKVSIPLILLSWSIPLFLLKRKSGYYMVFYFYAFTIFIFCLFTGLHLSQRVGGFLLFSLVALMWIEKKSIMGNIYILNISKKISSIFIHLFFIIQISSAGIFLYSDIIRPFSNAENIYNYIYHNIETETPIYAGLYCNYIGINNYGELNMHIASQPNEIKYCDWRILNINKNKSYLNQAIELMNSNAYQEMILLSPKEVIDFEVPMYRIQLLSQLENALVKNENAFIYLIKKDELK